jgi:hypothetical protein
LRVRHVTDRALEFIQILSMLEIRHEILLSFATRARFAPTNSQASE